MSILIKGMEMPKDKEITLCIDEKGEVYIYGSYPTELYSAVELPPHGKWKYQTMVHESGIKANGVECSICGATYNLSITLPDMMVEALNFCPNCGADMRETCNKASDDAVNASLVD